MNETSESKPGIWTALRRILDTMLATLQNRVEVFAVELQEEKCRLIEALLCAAAVAAFGMMTLTLLSFTLVTLFWENGRTTVLVSLCVLYSLVTAFAWRALRLRLKSRRAFSATLDEIKKDRSCLGIDS